MARNGFSGPLAVLVDRPRDNSLPVPLSPRIRTVTSSGATRPICLQISRTSDERPTIRSGLQVVRGAAAGSAHEPGGLERPLKKATHLFEVEWLAEVVEAPASLPRSPSRWSRGRSRR